MVWISKKTVRLQPWICCNTLGNDHSEKKHTGLMGVARNTYQYINNITK